VQSRHIKGEATLDVTLHSLKSHTCECVTVKLQADPPRCFVYYSTKVQVCWTLTYVFA